MKVLTGCGGWGYFNVPGNRLQAYTQAYEFVETNSTFYRMPTQLQLKTWRKTVPEDFEFTVKANRELTHEEALRPTDRAYEVFDGMRQVCEKLKAEILVLQTPPSFETPIQEVKDFFSSTDTTGLTVVWEPRGEKRDIYLSLARDLGITPSVDISLEKPFEKEDILYTRVFGPDKKMDLPDPSLEKIAKRVEVSGAKKGYVTFHGSKMYKDAARFLVYRKGER